MKTSRTVHCSLQLLGSRQPSPETGMASVPAESRNDKLTLGLVHGTVQHCTVWQCTVQYSTIQYSTVQHNTVQYSTAQYNTVQHSTVQYSTVFTESRNDKLRLGLVRLRVRVPGSK